MAATNRRNPVTLGDSLFSESCRFEFFQLVRLLQRAHPDGTPVGSSDDPTLETLRFSSDCSFSFPASTVKSAEPAPDGEKQDQMVVNFMGLATPASFGSLPSSFTEQIQEQEYSNITTLRDFLDLFNHRLISLFYRAWLKCRPAIAYETARPGHDGLFEKAVFSLLGFGTSGVRNKLPVNDQTVLALAAQMRRRPASATAVGDLVSSHFQIPVEVRQLIPQNFVIEENERSRLGVFGCELGKTLTIGSEVCIAQNSFRLRLGPLTWQQYCEFLPGGECYDAIVALVRTAVGLEFDFDFQMILAADAVPGLCLNSGKSRNACRLGWSTWLCTEQLANDPSDVLVSSELGL